MKRCDHKFIDSTSCLKCGWTPAEADFPKQPLSELATIIVGHLAKANGRVNAITAAELGDLMELPSRRVREIISNEFEAITTALPAPLIALPPGGYWLSTDAEDLRERQAWLTANRDRYDDQLLAHTAMCERHGLAGVLKDSPRTNQQTNKPTKES